MNSIRVPGLFVFNTLILASSSYCIQRCRRYFDLKNEKMILRWGFLTLAATVLFLILQGFAWYRLLSQQVMPGSSGGHGYLYAIPILHFLHVTAVSCSCYGILLPLYFSGKEGNTALYFLHDDQRTKLKHTAWYWHFIDVMWVYLMVFFLVNSLV